MGLTEISTATTFWMGFIRNVRILLTTGIYPPDIGGPATFIPEFATTLVEMGHQVTVLTLTNELDRVEKTLFTTHFVSRKGFRLWRQIKTVYFLVKYLQQADLVFANGLHEEVGTALRVLKNFDGYSVAKIVGDPVWERAINADQTQSRIGDFNAKMSSKYSIQRRVLVASLNRFKLITAPSNDLLSLAESWGVVKPMAYIPNGIRVSDAASEVEVFDLITVSRLTQWKNIDCVISVAIEFNLRLAIVGSGPEYEKLINLASGHSNIELLGEKSCEEIKLLLQQSKIYIALSNYEGLSFSLLQAMMLKRTCIVSDIPGNSQVITNQEDGILVSASSQSELRTEIGNCISDEKLRSYLGENARAKVIQEFDIKSYAKELLRKVEGNA
jgi:glycosyltransferase involved in cell wall biosynthesis